MIHTCEEGDTHFESHKRRNVIDQPCGLTYNDANNSTICPHKVIGSPLFVKARGLAPRDRMIADDGMPKP